MADYHYCGTYRQKYLIIYHKSYILISNKQTLAKFIEILYLLTVEILMNKIYYLPFLALLTRFGLAQAQQRVSGRVIAQDNQQGLPGATVLVKGTTTVRAANGVVIVTTRQGKKGPFRCSTTPTETGWWVSTADRPCYRVAWASKVSPPAPTMGSR